MSLWSKTIWAKGAIPPTVDRDKRRLKKFYLPLLDVSFIIGGWAAARYGVPALEDVFPDNIQDVFGLALSVLGLVAMIGLAFPKLLILEIVAKWTLVSTMALYMGSLVFLVGGGGNSRAFVVVIAFIAMILVLFRLDMAANEWREKRLAEAIAEAKSKMEAGR